MNYKLPVTYEDIQSAAKVLKGVAHQTPVFTSSYADEKVEFSTPNRHCVILLSNFRFIISDTKSTLYYFVVEN